MNGSDHLDLLGFKVYGKPPTPKQWTGGSDAAILKDAAETISRLEADNASKDQTIATLTERIEAAYREGFQDGFDHGNLTYKYPDVDEAWPQSQAAAALAKGGESDA
ncbi:MAG: hypothetical protein KDB18_10185 [Salinibacterium sp.]|nr:hypothetical protein [Salinibacterium sp.]